MTELAAGEDALLTTNAELAEFANDVAKEAGMIGNALYPSDLPRIVERVRMLRAYERRATEDNPYRAPKSHMGQVADMIGRAWRLIDLLRCVKDPHKRATTRCEALRLLRDAQRSLERQED